MNKRFFVILVAAVGLALLLGACTRSASTQSVTSTPAKGELPFLVGTEPVQAQGEAAKSAPTATAIPTVAPQSVVPPAEPKVVVVQPSPVPAESSSQSSGIVSGRPDTYSLRWGEWPICIARRFDLNINDLFSMNGLSMESFMPVGYTMKIPQTGHWSSNFGPRALAHHPAKYTVQTGDSIFIIACKFGDVTPEAIISANGLSEAGAVTSGQVLNIP